MKLSSWSVQTECIWVHHPWASTFRQQHRQARLPVQWCPWCYTFPWGCDLTASYWHTKIRALSNMWNAVNPRFPCVSNLCKIGTRKNQQQFTPLRIRDGSHSKFFTNRIALPELNEFKVHAFTFRMPNCLAKIHSQRKRIKNTSQSNRCICLIFDLCGCGYLLSPPTF